MTEKCLKINTISLLGCPLLTDESLKRLAHNKSLQVLKIDGKILFVFQDQLITLTVEDDFS